MASILWLDFAINRAKDKTLSSKLTQKASPLFPLIIEEFSIGKI